MILSSYINDMVKIMLHVTLSTLKDFSALDGRREGLFIPQDAAIASSGTAPLVTLGEQVVFERLDLAEILGIWRHARGEVLDVSVQEGQAPTVDVRFEGHETLRGYLPELFRKAA